LQRSGSRKLPIASARYLESSFPGYRKELEDSMKRNWDVVRELLTKVEECSKPGDAIQLSAFPTERLEEVSYHMALLMEAGLVDGHVSKTSGAGPHDFLAYR
jgi:hypothetical protein